MSIKLKPKQKHAAYLLALGLTGREVSHRLNMRAETLSRWKHMPEFRREMERQLDEERIYLQHKLAHMLQASVNALWQELHEEYGSKRFHIALSVLRMAGEGILAPPLDPRQAAAPVSIDGEVVGDGVGAMLPE